MESFWIPVFGLLSWSLMVSSIRPRLRWLEVYVFRPDLAGGIAAIVGLIEAGLNPQVFAKERLFFGCVAVFLFVWVVLASVVKSRVEIEQEWETLKRERARIQALLTVLLSDMMAVYDEYLARKSAIELPYNEYVSTYGAQAAHPIDDELEQLANRAGDDFFVRFRGELAGIVHTCEAFGISPRVALESFFKQEQSGIEVMEGAINDVKELYTMLSEMEIGQR
jgi:hypothetical protein